MSLFLLYFLIIYILSRLFKLGISKDPLFARVKGYRGIKESQNVDEIEMPSK